VTPFRIIFLLISTAAVGATGYVTYYGYGGESSGLDKSVRVGSGGGGYYRSNRVK
jgi:hypothetical protein